MARTRCYYTTSSELVSMSMTVYLCHGCLTDCIRTAIDQGADVEAAVVALLKAYQEVSPVLPSLLGSWPGSETACSRGRHDRDFGVDGKGDEGDEVPCARCSAQERGCYGARRWRR